MPTTIVTDDNSVYYRFCGGALASMLHARYKKRDTCKLKQKESVNREIKILNCIKCSDKSQIPYELQYRDRGYMYFPSKDFLDFLKDVDACVIENTNVKALQQYSSKLVEVTTHALTERKKFNTLVSEKLADIKENVDFFRQSWHQCSQNSLENYAIHILKNF